MPHEFGDLSQQSHETLTNFLIGGGLGGIGMLLFVAFLHWRGKRRGGPPKPPPAGRRKGRRNRHRR